MEEREALDLISTMLQREPDRRGQVAGVLEHPFWINATQKLDRVCKMCDDRSPAWDGLRRVRMPKPWLQDESRWQELLKDLLSIMHSPESYERGKLQGIAKLLRNARAHLLEHDPAVLQRLFGEAVGPSNKDAVLERYFGARLPEIFVIILIGPQNS